MVECKLVQPRHTRPLPGHRGRPALIIVSLIAVMAWAAAYGSLTLCNVYKCGCEKACNYKVIINRKTFSQYIHGTTVVI